MGELSKLKGLGPKSEKYLNDIGIYTRQDLEAIGAIKAFIKLSTVDKTKPGLNFLYAMVGALEDRSWTDIVKTEKTRLLIELASYQELEEILKKEGATNEVD